MSSKPTLLVVDDEQVICQACQRIFARQGYEVEVSTDSPQGLAWATERDYGAILLDIKMPRMDGIEFLEKLRAKNPDVPVLIMTGYPSVPNAAAAIRLGAADYVTKPFTPEEITRAVQRVIAQHAEPEAIDAAGAHAIEPTAPPEEGEVLFYRESWLRLEADGSACVGAVLPGLRGAEIKEIRLPRIGEVVYQGLPMASVRLADRAPHLVPAPLSGVIAAVNEELAADRSRPCKDPCGEGWLACICTTRFEEEIPVCRPRRIVLLNGDCAAGGEQSRTLAALGCRVTLISTPEELPLALGEAPGAVVMIDAASFGEAGPGLVGQVNAQAPEARVVVIAPAGEGAEKAYRQHHIFYYAVAPFADDEIADILDAAFRVPEPAAAKGERPRGPAEPLSSITMTNRNGHKVQLMSAPGLLWRHEGLGGMIGAKLLDEAYPVVMTPGEANLTPSNVLKTAGTCDRLMVLMSRDYGALPGCLARDTKPEFSVEAGDVAGKVTMLTVQPDAMGGIAGLDEHTTDALAEHLVHEMASY